MRAGLLYLTAIIGCFATVGTPPGGAENKLLAGKDNQKPIKEALIDSPIIPIDRLIEQTPDGSEIIELYRSARTVRDVEAANENTQAQVMKVQSIAADVARLHAATFKSCDGSEAPQSETIAKKARDFSAALARVDAELTKSLAATRQKVEGERPGSIRAREEVNRLVLAQHKLGSLRMQAHELTKAIDSLGASIHVVEGSCTPTSVAPLFAERDTHLVGASVSQSTSLSQKRVTKAKPAQVPRFSW